MTSHLDALEAEAIHVLREVAAEFRNPVILYAVGKDSSILLHLAAKAFAPGRIPFPLLHIDTTWNFRDLVELRDETAARLGLDLIVHTNAEGIERGIDPFRSSIADYTRVMKTEALKQALGRYGFDAAIAGGRRDEEPSRAKERMLSFRNAQHAWDPRDQRPELWRLFNTRIRAGESIRAFPLSNWTEADVWTYIRREGIPVSPLYFAADRKVVERRDALIMVDDARMPLAPGEEVHMRRIRFRTLGCYPLTAAIESDATDIDAILAEMAGMRTTERHGRLSDRDQGTSLERHKREGYF